MDLHLVSARHAFVGRVTICAAACCTLLAVPKESSGQIVTPKTLPVLQDGQFDMLPSDRAGMGGVSIAVDDTLLDAFVNPAKATRLSVRHFVSTPFFHSISGGRGGGRTLPVGGGGSWGNWSATGLFTYQQLDRVPPATVFFPGPILLESGSVSQSSTSGRSAYNQYIAGSIARRLSPSTSLGFGLELAALEAIDGVDLLYPGSDGIEQSGNLANFRVGLTKEMSSDGQLELMLVHARTEMTHDVHFTTARWDPVAHQTVWSERSENNRDQTRIWGVHSEYSRSVGSEGWRLGWLGTANRLSHPKIPNYVIQSLPRDPGTTYSFNLGTGVGRTINRTSFGADFIFEPMISNTWATAARDTTDCIIDCVPVRVIKAGERTVDNNFHFRNMKVRLGAGQETAPRPEGSTTFGYQVGLDLYAITYRLHQIDHVRATDRTQHEDWLEWTPTLGLRLHSHPLDVRYNFSLTCGPGSCNGGSSQATSINVPDVSTGIIAAPSSRLFMQSGSLRIHKLTIVVPIH